MHAQPELAEIGPDSVPLNSSARFPRQPPRHRWRQMDFGETMEEIPWDERRIDEKTKDDCASSRRVIVMGISGKNQNIFLYDNIWRLQEEKPIGRVLLIYFHLNTPSWVKRGVLIRRNKAINSSKEIQRILGLPIST